MGYAAVALTDLEGLAGTSFPHVGGIEDQQLYLGSDLISDCLLYTSPSPRDTR